MNNKRARVIAYYLPQFHPVPCNDEFWGKGFTEWTNVAKAKPLYRGHYQPRIPADLGFYDLRLPQVRKAQAELAKEAGIEGFCYWHYWFKAGSEVLEMPFDEVVKSGEPDFPFCLGWANHDWTTKTWDKGTGLSKDTMIFKQEYPGEEDNIKHFYRLLPAFKDHRYITVDGKLLFSIIAPKDIADLNGFMKLWNKLAYDNGLNGFHFVGVAQSIPQLDIHNIKHIDSFVENTFKEHKGLGLNGVSIRNQKYAEIKSIGILHKLFFGAMRRFSVMPFVEKYNYSKIIKNIYTKFDEDECVYPELLAGWDRSPRQGRKAVIYEGTTPQSFKEAAERAVKCVENKSPQHKIVFLNSWNEWGEGAYLEPDLKYGKGMIEALNEMLTIKKEDI